ncbi:PAS domain S-box protein [Polaromonas glacialis]|uniref:PAS domain S-box protein n=1 Tax=Polaromonas glacialis TaxID=866564 RepID=UPI00068BC1B7|nr:PAS domain S-box protein [Polaromonas glacialis]
MKFDITLRTRLVVLVLAAILPLFGLAVVGAVLTSGKAVSQARTNLEFSASLLAANQERVAASAYQILTAIANMPVVQEGRDADCQQYLQILGSQALGYVNLGIVSLDGSLRCMASDGSPGEFAGDQPYFQEAIARQGFVASGFPKGRSGTPAMVFAQPVVNKQGNINAVAFAAVSLSELSKSLSEAPLPRGTHFVVTDRQGIVLASNLENPMGIGQTLRDPALLAAVKSGVGGGYEGKDFTGTQQIYAFQPSGKSAEAPFFVAVSVDKSEVLKPARQRLVLVYLALTLVAIFGSWIAWMLGGRVIVKPVAEILAATRQLQAGRLDMRIALECEDDPSEFTQISTGFNRMAEALQAQQGLREAELSASREVQQKLRDAQLLARIGYWQFDLATGQLRLSDEIFDFLGIDAALFEGNLGSLLNRVHRSDRQAFQTACNTAIQTGTNLDIEFRVVLGGGHIRWIHQFGLASASSEAGQSLQRTGVIQDITARKSAELALVNSEQRYAALFNKAPVSMWVYDIATNRFLAVNQAACRAYGYSEAQFLSMRIFDIRPAAEHEELRQWLGDPLRKSAVWHDLRKDGSLFPVETVSQPVQYAGRNARFVIAMDKTVQEKTEKDAQEYLFTLQRAADAAQAITWHRTLEGTMQEIAEQARGVIGAHQAAVCLSADSMHPQTMHALSLSEKYEAYRGMMKPTDGSAIYAVVCENNRCVRMTQAQLEAHPGWRNFGSHGEAPPPMRGWLAVPLMGRDGKNIGVLQLSDKYEGEFTKQDEYVALELSHLASAGLENTQLLEEIGQLNAVLEQRVAQRTAALVRQEALFRALAEQAPQMVWTASPDGRATYYNRAWFDLMGGTLTDWSGYQWLAVIHPEDVAGIKHTWAISRENRSQYAGIRRMKASDGSFHTMAYRASPVLDDHGKVAFWVGIDADITEIKAIEAALRLSNQELEAFSYSVSHDLRSPLNTIDGFSKLLAKQLAPQIAGDAGVKASHYLMRIQAGVAQMGQLIEDLLSLSQVSRAPLNTALVDLSLMAHKLLEEWSTRQPERQVTVTVEDGLQAHGDERLVRVMMENLLANAWKFTGQEAQAEISVGQQSDLAGFPVFFIKDNGAGFDMAYADKLFQPFQRLHSASEFSGTGIGLATVSRVIKRHGGRIWAESAPARGTTFFFTLS